jgi:hypothetical protein
MKTQPKFPARDSRDKLYCELDPESGLWGVFGDRSGHCYATFCSKEEAIERYPGAQSV